MGVVVNYFRELRVDRLLDHVARIAANEIYPSWTDLDGPPENFSLFFFMVDGFLWLVGTPTSAISFSAEPSTAPAHAGWGAHTRFAFSSKKGGDAMRYGEQLRTTGKSHGVMSTTYRYYFFLVAAVLLSGGCSTWFTTRPPASYELEAHKYAFKGAQF